jgi:hypothetical protein
MKKKTLPRICLPSRQLICSPYFPSGDQISSPLVSRPCELCHPCPHLTDSQGDLGVQRGLIRWFLSLYSPLHPCSISPKKISGQSRNDKDITNGAQPKDTDVLPVFGQGEHGQDSEHPDSDMLPAPDISSVPPAAGSSTPLRQGKECEPPSMPTPFTPSINKTLSAVGLYGNSQTPKPAPLPEGLSVGVLKSRLDGKKKIKYVLIDNCRVVTLDDHRMNLGVRC